MKKPKGWGRELRILAGGRRSLSLPRVCIPHRHQKGRVVSVMRKRKSEDTMETEGKARETGGLILAVIQSLLWASLGGWVRDRKCESVNEKEGKRGKGSILELWSIKEQVGAENRGQHATNQRCGETAVMSG